MPSDDVSFRSVSSVIEISLAKLQAGQASVEAAFHQQLLVGARGNQPALVQHRDIIRVQNGRQAVGDNDGRAIFHQFLQRQLHLVLAFSVQCAGCLIQ